MSREESARFAAESMLSGSPGSQHSHNMAQQQQQHFIHPDYGSFGPIYSSRMYPRLAGSVQSLFNLMQRLLSVDQEFHFSWQVQQVQALSSTTKSFLLA
jgi:hypothetical protein